MTAVNALDPRCSNFGSMVLAPDQSGSSSTTAEDGVASIRRRGVAGVASRTSSIPIGEYDKGIRFRSLHAAIIDNGDAHRLERHVGGLI